MKSRQAQAILPSHPCAFLGNNFSLSSTLSTCRLCCNVSLDPVTRPKLLLSLVGILALIWIGLWIAQGWGTITLVFDKKPLSSVLRSFTSQSKLKIITDIDLNTPITIKVRRVPVVEALEAIQAAAESRGRLAFLIAPDRSGLQNLISLMPRPGNQSGIKSLEYRMPFLFVPGTEELPQWRDPRDQVWTPSEQTKKDLLSLVEDAAQKTDIRILFSESWNPTVTKSLSSGPLRTSLPSLAKSSGGTGELVYLLPGQRTQNETSDRNPSNPERWRQNWSEGTPLSADAFAERLKNRSVGLSGDRAKEMQVSVEESVKQYRSWLALTPEEREKRMQEMIQDPNRQQRGSDRFSRAMRMMSPSQRASRYSRYNSQKESVKDPGHTR